MFILVFVLLLAWMMFVVHLDLESMWSDEWFSWMYAIQGPFALVRATAQDVHPPAYYLLVSAWVAITGSQSLFAMRLTAAFPALITVALSYRLGVDWFKSRWAGIGAAVFLGTSGIFIYYARELRMYALMVMLVALSWVFLTRFLQGRSKSLLGYIACVGLMAYTYYFSAFVLFTQIAIVVWFYRHKLIALLRAYVVVFIAFLPWIPTVLDQLFWERARTGDPNAPVLGKYGATQPTTLPNIGNFIEIYTAKQPAFVLLLIVLALALSWNAVRHFHLNQRFREQRWLIAATSWLFLTIVLMFGLNLAFPIYNQRYVLSVIPALALLAGVAVASLSNRRIGAALVGVIAVSGMIFHSNAFLEPKTPHKDMLQTIAAEYRPGDRIWYNFSYGGLGSSITQEVGYHLKFDAPSLNSDEFIWDAPNDYADVKAVPRVWDVRPYWIPVPGKALAPLTSDRVQSEEYDFGAYAVRLYEAPPTSETPLMVGDLFTLLPDGVQKNQYHAGDIVIVKTWWQAQKPPLLDYSYVLELNDKGGILAHQDAGLTSDTIPTSQWFLGQPYRLSQISFKLPDNLAPGTYTLMLGVYFWQDPQPLPITFSDTSASAATQIRAQVATVVVTE
ncbi:MAG: hypothetical protein GC204_11390 [Chloroflexi bacterium]|nr:hypothetical protein [Chloroflexota bacterium]